MQPRSILRAFFWLLLLLPSLLLARMTLRYYNFRPDINFLRAKQWIVHDPIWRTAFYIHITGGTLALILGPFQMLKRLRQKWKVGHRTLGKIYVVAILAIAAPAGLYMSLFAEGGAWATAGFSIMAMLWFATTLQAYRSARARRFSEHRQWMVRSYALTFSAVTLRIWVPVSSMYFGMDHRDVIVLSAWISWLLNLAIAEAILQLGVRRRFHISKSSSYNRLSSPIPVSEAL